MFWYMTVIDTLFWPDPTGIITIIRWPLMLLRWRYTPLLLLLLLLLPCCYLVIVALFPLMWWCSYDCCCCWLPLIYYGDWKLLVLCWQLITLLLFINYLIVVGEFVGTTPLTLPTIVGDLLLLLPLPCCWCSLLLLLLLIGITPLFLPYGVDCYCDGVSITVLPHCSIVRLTPVLLIIGIVTLIYWRCAPTLERCYWHGTLTLRWWCAVMTLLENCWLFLWYITPIDDDGNLGGVLLLIVFGIDWLHAESQIPLMIVNWPYPPNCWFDLFPLQLCW